MTLGYTITTSGGVWSRILSWEPVILRTYLSWAVLDWLYKRVMFLSVLQISFDLILVWHLSNSEIVFSLAYGYGESVLCLLICFLLGRSFVSNYIFPKSVPFLSLLLLLYLSLTLIYLWLRCSFYLTCLAAFSACLLCTGPSSSQADTWPLKSKSWYAMLFRLICFLKCNTKP